MYKTTSEMGTPLLINRDIFSCPKGVGNREVPLYMIIYIVGVPEQAQGWLPLGLGLIVDFYTFMSTYLSIVWV